MLDPAKARWFGKAFSGRSDPLPATLAELTASCLFAPPCCAHIALCDGACRDTRPNETRSGAFATEDDPR